MVYTCPSSHKRLFWSASKYSLHMCAYNDVLHVDGFFELEVKSFESCLSGLTYVLCALIRTLMIIVDQSFSVVRVFMNCGG